MNDEWELDPETTLAVIQPWVEDEEAVRLARLRVDAEIRKENAIQKFRK